MKTRTQKTVVAAMFASLCCVATMVIKIPSPLNGYINLGDAIVLLSGWLLPAGYGFAAAGLGSALADIFSGYTLYAPATFLIKGIMALIAYTMRSKTSSRIFGGALAEIAMIVGYYVFEGVMYGFSASLVNIPPNAIQGVAGLVIGFVLVKIFEKSKMF